MRVTTSTKRTYIPRIAGNKDLPPEDQISVELTLPTVEEREDLTSYRYFPDGSFTIHHRTREMIARHVRSISNLEESDSGKTTKLDTGEKLLAAVSRPARELVEELKIEILRGDELTEGEEKNSESPVNYGSSDGQA